MKCCRCNRPILSTPAATIKTKAGLMAFGPKCARIAGLTERAARRRAAVAPRPQPERPNPDQMTLELEA